MVAFEIVEFLFAGIPLKPGAVVGLDGGNRGGRFPNPDQYLRVGLARVFPAHGAIRTEDECGAGSGFDASVLN